MKKSEMFQFGPWTVTSTKGSILKAEETERLSTELALPSLPEMTFGDSMLEIKHASGFGIQFSAVEALKLVDNKHDLMKVAAADQWQRERKDSEFIKEVIKPFDWTYTTNYKGTLIGKDDKCFNRVMQSSIFLLLRFFLRVDGVIVRINDTRLYHEAGSTFVLREYTSKEKEVSKIKCSLTDPAVLNEMLDTKTELYEKLEFPESVDAISGVANS